MNILIINHYAGAPSKGMEYRHYYLAKEWQKLGHNVLIVCASFTHLRSNQFKIKKDYQYCSVEGVNYLILKANNYSDNDYKRLLNILTFITRLSFYWKRIEREFKPDIIISSSTYVFDIYSAKKMSLKSNAKLIFEVKDLWPLAIVETAGYSRLNPFISLMYKAEAFAYKNSDKVVSLLPKALDYMIENGLNSEKYNYIPNGISVEEWKIDEKIPEEIDLLITEEKSKGKKLICYAGNLGITNSLYSLIDAIKHLENENVVLFLIGNGQEKERLKKHSEKLNLKNVYFLPGVSKNKIPSILNKMNLLYIGLKNQPVFRFGISPNKLMDYMMAGKPIIQAINAGNDIVSEAGCGLTIEPDNSFAISEAVKFLISKSETELEIMGKKGKEYCLKNHEYRVLAKKFIDVMKN